MWRDLSRYDRNHTVAIAASNADTANKPIPFAGSSAITDRTGSVSSTATSIAMVAANALSETCCGDGRASATPKQPHDAIGKPRASTKVTNPAN